MNLVSNPSKRNTTILVIISIVAALCLTLIYFEASNMSFTARISFKNYTKDDIIDTKFNSFYHYVNEDGLNSFTEAYCTVSERFTVKDGDKFFTVFYNPTSEKCVLSFEYSYHNCYILDSELLNEAELKEYINSKASCIKEEFLNGLNNTFTNFSMTRNYAPAYDDICTDGYSSYGNKEAKIVINAASGDKTVSLKIVQENDLYYDYGEGNNHYYLSTSHFTNKANEFIGTVSDEAEFDGLLHDNGIDRTFSEIFGK